MPFTLIPSQFPHFAVQSLPYPSAFGCVIYNSFVGNYLIGHPHFAHMMLICVFVLFLMGVYLKAVYVSLCGGVKRKGVRWY